MVAATAKAAPKLNLIQIARECLDSTDDQAAATAQLVRRAMSDEALLDAIVGRRLGAICHALIQQAANEDRRKLEGRRGGEPRVISAGEFAGAVSISMLDYRVGGRRIGSMRRGELTIQAEGLASQAQDASIKSRWLRLISQAMPNEDKTVDEALTSEKLAELRAKALEVA